MPLEGHGFAAVPVSSRIKGGKEAEEQNKQKRVKMERSKVGTKVK